MKFYQVLPEQQARGIADTIRGLSWSHGKARTKELTGTVKQNSEILNHGALQMIGKRIAAHPGIQLDAIPLKLHPPKFSRYIDGQHYKAHTDAPWMGETRTDLSCTVWLTDEYEGGELVIGGEPVKGLPGMCVLYDCGEVHEVRPVTSGARIAAVTWIQSRIRDPGKRRLVREFRQFLSNFEDDYDLFTQGGRIHSALLRRWVE